MSKPVTDPTKTPSLPPEMMAELAKLSDITLPDPVGWWPLADSVWGILIGLLGIVVGLIWVAINNHKQNKYRREATAKLNTLTTCDTLIEKITLINQLLKQVAITHYGRSQASNLAGKSWVTFLKTTAQHIEQPATLEAILALGYQPTLDEKTHINAVTEFQQYAQQWIKGHHK